MHPVICGLTNGVTCIPRYPASLGSTWNRIHGETSLDRFDFYPPNVSRTGLKGVGKRSSGRGSKRREAEREEPDWLLPVQRGQPRYDRVSVGKFARVGVRKNIIRSWIRKGVDSTPTSVPDGRSLAYSSSSLLYCLPYE